MAHGSIDIMASLKREEEAKEEQRTTQQKKESFHEWPLSTWGCVLMLLLILIAHTYLAFQPMNLPGLEDDISAIFWEQQDTILQQSISENYGQASTITKNNMYLQGKQEARSNPEILAQRDREIEIAKRLYQDDSGRTYYFNKEAYAIFNGEGVLGGLVSEDNGYYFHYLLSIMVLLLVFFAVSQYSVYGGLLSSFMLAIHPLYLKVVHPGYLGSIIVYLLGLSLVALSLRSRHHKVWVLPGFLGLGLSYVAWPGSVALTHTHVGFIAILFGVLGGVAAMGRKEYLGVVTALFGLLALFGQPYVALFALAIAAGIGFSTMEKSIGSFLHTLMIGFRKPTLVGCVLFMFVFSLFAGSLNVGLPVVDDSVVSMGQRLQIGGEQVVSSTAQQQVMQYYSKKEVIADNTVLLGDGTLCTNCLLAVTQDDFNYVDLLSEGRYTNASYSRIYDCFARVDDVVCQNGYIIRNGAATHREDVLAEFINVVGGTTKTNPEGKGVMVFYNSTRGLHAMVAERAFSTTPLFKLFTGQGMGYTEVYSVAYPQQGRIYTT